MTLQIMVTTKNGEEVLVILKTEGQIEVVRKSENAKLGIMALPLDAKAIFGCV